VDERKLISEIIDSIEVSEHCYIINNDEELTQASRDGISKTPWSMIGEINQEYIQQSINSTETEQKMMNVNWYWEQANQLKRFKDITNMIPSNARFRFTKRIINKLIKVSTRHQQVFNNILVNILDAIVTKTTYFLEKNTGEVQRLTEINKIVERRIDLMKDRIGEDEKGIELTNQHHIEINHKVDMLAEEISNCRLAMSKYTDHVYEEQEEIFNSYSQCGEDKIVTFILIYLKRGGLSSEITYLDIGCSDYKHMNNTYSLYRKGYRGVLIEVNPYFIEELKLKRPEDKILNIGIGKQSGKNIPFYVVNGNMANLLNKKVVDEILKENPMLSTEVLLINIDTLNNVIREQCPVCPTIISIDIGGDEFEVLSEMDFVTNRPLILIVEIIPNRKYLSANTKRNDIILLMEKNSYVEFAFTGASSIFVDCNKINL
jgi:hypothetical protein